MSTGGTPGGPPDPKDFLTPEARAAAERAGRKLTSAAAAIGERAREAFRGSIPALSQGGPALPPPQSPASVAEKKKERTSRTEPSGLRVETEPMDWPPKDMKEARLQILLHLAEFYDFRRRRIEKERKEKTTVLDNGNKSRSDARRTRLIVAAIAFGVAGLFVLVAATTRDYRTANNVVPLIMIAVLVALGFLIAAIVAGKPWVAPLQDEEHPPERELDALYDTIWDNDYKSLWAQAWRLMAFENAGKQEREAGPFYNFPDRDMIGKSVVLRRAGKDGQVRYTPRSVYYLSFHANQIITYEGAFDVLKGQAIYNKVREFSYQDVTSVTRTQRILREERVVVPDSSTTVEMIVRQTESGTVVEARDGSKGEEKIRVVTQEIFQLDLINGQSVSFVLHEHYHIDGAADPAMPQSSSDRIVEMIRGFVRDKKRNEMGRQYADREPVTAPFGQAFGQGSG